MTQLCRLCHEGIGKAQKTVGPYLALIPIWDYARQVCDPLDFPDPVAAVPDQAGDRPCLRARLCPRRL